MKIKKYIKKTFLSLLVTCMVIGTSQFINMVEAASPYDGWTDITSSWSAGTSVTSGNYRLSANKTIEAGATVSGLVINGTVNLYIPTGMSLTVKGGNASGTTGAGAGIELPSGKTLRVYGGGTIEAKGGNASAQTQGGPGIYSISEFTGGPAGNGGAGAGAGIGGRGGNGGVGSDDSLKSGGDGQSGGSMGNLYIYDTVTIITTGGTVQKIQFNRNGGYFSGVNITGGGHGGAAGQAANIGGGGTGGGGGVCGNWKTIFSAYGGAAGGGTGPNALGAMGSSASFQGTDANGLTGGAGRYSDDGRDTYSARGGNASTGGTGGNMYVAKTAAVSELTGDTTSGGHGKVASRTSMTAIELNNQGADAGKGGPESLAGANGQPLPYLSSLPEKTGYTFGGYFADKNGVGTQYINSDGSSKSSWSSGTEIYAYWTPVNYTLTLTKEGITAIDVTGATLVSEGVYSMTYGTKVTMKATVEEGKDFIAWYGSDDTYTSINQEYTFDVPAKDMTFNAVAMKGVWVEDSITNMDVSDFAPDKAVETKYSKVDVNVSLDDTNKDLGNVTLRDKDGNILLDMSGSDGKYSYTDILNPSGDTYYVYVGDQKTGQTVDFSKETTTPVDIKYYSVTVNTKLDGTPYNPGNLTLVNTKDSSDTIPIYYDEDLGYTYYYQKLDDTKTYTLHINGEDTKEDVIFNKKNEITIEYHTAKIETKLDSITKAMGTITLVDGKDVKYTLTSVDGKYQYIAKDTGSYDIYLNDKETGKKVTFGDTKQEIAFYTVSYKITDPTTVSGDVPASGYYQEGTTIKVAGAGNLEKKDYHFVGWQKEATIYNSGSTYEVTQTTEFIDAWEADVDTSAKWSFDNGATWHFGTIAQAVDVTLKTEEKLQVVIQKSGVFPTNKDMTVRNNQVWTINDSVDVKVPSSSSITNQGSFTNKGILSGDGELSNEGMFYNGYVQGETVKNGVVTLPTITNTKGTLVGGQYGEILGTSSKKVVITDGTIQAFSYQTGSGPDVVTKYAPVIIGDYSTTKNVVTYNKDVVVSVMGGGTIDGKPSDDQLRDIFGGLARYDDETKAVVLEGNLIFRTAVTYKDIAVDPGDKGDGGSTGGGTGGGDAIDLPRIKAHVYEVKDGTQYIENEGGTATIRLGMSSKGPSMAPEMMVPVGSNIELEAIQDNSNGYVFVGWYSNPVVDVDSGAITKFNTEIAKANTPTVGISAVSASEDYYAVFEKKKYTLEVHTDQATTAVVKNNDVEVETLEKKDNKTANLAHGDVVTVEPTVVENPSYAYSFYGYLKSNMDGTRERLIQYEKVPEDGYKEGDANPIMVDKPMLYSYSARADQPFTYEISTLTLLKGHLTYDLNGGAVDISSGDVIEDIDLISAVENDFTITTVKPQKPGWKFDHWVRVDIEDTTGTKYGYGEGNHDKITLTGDEKNAGVILSAVYTRDPSTPYFVKKSVGSDEVGYETLNEAVTATRDGSSMVFGQTDIYFDAGASTPVGQVYGQLPNGYTLIGRGPKAKLTIPPGKTLQIGEETIANDNNNKDGSWKTGAHTKNIDFIVKGNQWILDGQHSWIEDGTVYVKPGNKIHLLSDMNTGNHLNVEVWNKDGTSASSTTSDWKANDVLVTSDASDGDTAIIDGSDESFNHMAGRIHIGNSNYALYNDRTNDPVTNGYSLRLFDASDVHAARVPFTDSTLEYSDTNYVMEYRTVQEAIEDASRENSGGKDQAGDNKIYFFGENNENLVVRGDDPSLVNARFVDYGEKTYNGTVILENGTRTKNNYITTVTKNIDTGTLKGTLDLQGVNKKGTILDVTNTEVNGIVHVENESYMHVTNAKTWQMDEKITVNPLDKDGKIVNRMIVASGVSDANKGHFVMDSVVDSATFALYHEPKDNTIRVKYLGVSSVDAVVIAPDDITMHRGKEQTFTVTVTGPGYPEQTAKWSVAGAISADTKIDEDTGILVIGKDEPVATVLTITAKATDNEAIEDTTTVTVLPPVITSIDVTPKDTSMHRDTKQTMVATIQAMGYPNMEVTWSLENAGTDTTIDADGKLHIGKEESIGKTITIKATSKYDPTKVGTTTVKVLTPVVTSVEVTPDTASVYRGEKQSFTAKVLGDGNPDQTVTWKIEGKTSATTTIDANGVLTIGVDEALDSNITVTATATVDSSKSAQATVTIKEPVVEKVTVTPKIASIHREASQEFQAVVTGIGYPDQEVTWLVTGATKSGTTIDSSGKLTIDKDEPAGTVITVTATSAKDTSIQDSATVTVLTPTVETVEVTPTTIDMHRGADKTFQAKVNGIGNPDQTVTWTLEGTVDATTSVDNSGVVTLGKDEPVGAHITVKATSTVDTTKSGVATITVLAPKVTKVEVTPDTVDLQRGEEKEFTAVVTGIGNPEQTVTWKVEGKKDSKTSIDINGKVTIGKDEPAGNVLTIRATSSLDTSESGTAKVKVLPPEVTKVEVTPKTADLHRGDEKDFSVVVSGTGYPSQEVNWSISGQTHGDTFIDMSTGKLTISVDEPVDTEIIVIAESVEDASKSDEAKVKILKSTVTEVSITPKTPNVHRDETIAFSAKVDGVGYLSQDVTWTMTGNTSDQTTLDANGKLSIGETEKIGNHIEIKATANEDPSKTATTKVAVVLSIISVSLNKTESTMVKGSEEQLIATINPSDTSDSKELTWSSSDPSIAQVDKNGKVSAKGFGKAVITVTTSNGKKASCQIIVASPIVSVTLDKEEVQVLKGTKTTLNATINPSDTSDSKELTWSSSNPSVASVDSTGKITGINKGEAVVTVTTSNGKKATCKVYVLSSIEEDLGNLPEIGGSDEEIDKIIDQILEIKKKYEELGNEGKKDIDYETVEKLHDLLNKKSSIETKVTVLTPNELTGISAKNLGEAINLEDILNVIKNTRSIDVELFIKGLKEEQLLAASKKQLEESLNGWSTGKYLDMTLIKTSINLSDNSKEVTSIEELAQPIKVVMDIPKEIVGKQEYALQCLHNGEVSLIKDEDTNPNTMTVYVDKFSTYSIVYKEGPSMIETPTQKPNTEVTKKIDTSDGTTGKVWILTGLLSLSGYLLVCGKTRKKEEELEN